MAGDLHNIVQSTPARYINVAPVSQSSPSWECRLSWSQSQPGQSVQILPRQVDAVDVNPGALELLFLPDTVVVVTFDFGRIEDGLEQTTP